MWMPSLPYINILCGIFMGNQNNVFIFKVHQLFQRVQELAPHLIPCPEGIVRFMGDPHLLVHIKPAVFIQVFQKAGMVDVVARIVADDEARTFNFKSNEVIFGGGRLRVNAKDIPLNVDKAGSVHTGLPEGQSQWF